MEQGNEKKTALGFWNLKEMKFIKIGVLFIVVILAGQFLVQKVCEYREISQLEEPTQIRVSGGHVDREGTLVAIEMHLSVENGKEYKLIDSSDDGFFPNDTDSMIDKVSSTNRDGMWLQESFSKKLYSLLTEKYKQGLEEESDFLDAYYWKEKDVDDEE